MKSLKFPKLASEEFLPPIQKFNDTVGPLFSALNHMMPLDEHHQSGLARSLGVFLSFCFTKSMEQLDKLRPIPLGREDWTLASDETKQVHFKWQSNLTYLRSRNRHYIQLLGSPVSQPKSRFDDDDTI